MTTQRPLSGNPKSIAGGASVALGLLFLSGNLDSAAAQLSCPLGSAATEALGALPYAVLSAALHSLDFCAFDRHLLFQGFFETLVSFWVLLLVIFGALLLRAACTTKV